MNFNSCLLLVGRIFPFILISSSEAEPLLHSEKNSNSIDEEFGDAEKENTIPFKKIENGNNEKTFPSYSFSSPSQNSVPSETKYWNRIHFFHSIQRLWGLMVLAKGQNSILLIFISIANLLVVAKSGVVAGMFYNALVDKNLPLFYKALSHALLWYGASALCLSFKSLTSDFLIVRWRMALTNLAHDAYLQNSFLYPLSKALEQETEGKKIVIDNPDQRIAQEIQSFCDRMAEFLSKTLMAPILVIFYTFWVKSVIGWPCVMSIYACFLIGAVGCSTLVQSLSASVSEQERLQANFRANHMRVKNNAEGISFWRSFEFEKQFLNLDFEKVIKNQKYLVIKKFILSLATNSYDYMGAALMYVVLSFPIFGNELAKQEEMDAGKISQFISNSSFAILQLIFSFSQLIDSSKTFSELMGYAERVMDMFQILNLLPNRSSQIKSTQSQFNHEQSNHNPFDKDSSCSRDRSSCNRFSQDAWHLLKEEEKEGESSSSFYHSSHDRVKRSKNRIKLHEIDFDFHNTSYDHSTRPFFSSPYPLSSPRNEKSIEIQVSMHAEGEECATYPVADVANGMILSEYYIQTHMLYPPNRLKLFPNTKFEFEFEFSIHKVSGEQKMKLQRIFHLNDYQNIITVITCQRSCIDTCHSSSNPSETCHVYPDMDDNLDNFIRLCNYVRIILNEKGYWMDGIDPFSGYALSDETLHFHPHIHNTPLSSSSPSPSPSSLPLPLASPFPAPGDVMDSGVNVDIDGVINDDGNPSQLSDGHEVEKKSLRKEEGRKGSDSFKTKGEGKREKLEMNSSCKMKGEGKGEEVKREEGKGVEDRYMMREMERYSEVHASHLLLGYEMNDDGVCPLLIHPTFGKNCYPASFFTDAPLRELLLAMTSFEKMNRKEKKGEGREKEKEKKDELWDYVEESKREKMRDNNSNESVNLDVEENVSFARKEKRGEVEEEVKGYDLIEKERRGRRNEKDWREKREWIIWDKLTVLIPESDVCVVRNLSLGLERTDRMLIMGKSGLGKTSLLRALANVCPLSSGKVYFGEDHDLGSGMTKRVWFVPQKPLMSRGGLGAQILYPSPSPSPSSLSPCPLLSSSSLPNASKQGLSFNYEYDSHTRSRMVWSLQQVGLENMLPRFGNDWQSEYDWENVLSVGEKQRLSLSRIFFHLPEIEMLYMDESTNALSEELEDLIYQNLTNVGLTYVSISHKDGLRKWHNRMLHLMGNGEWKFQNCD